MLKEKILKTIQNYNLIEKNDKIIIGVSGGPDSMCLLDSFYYLQKQLQFEIIVAHVNHMIRKEADSETAYVENYCREKEIPCYCKRANIPELAKSQKMGTEEMGRKIRYDFFEEIALKTGANKIATAHHANDNSETVLMNLLRGSGISGLKGIEIKRTGIILNPLKISEKQHEESKNKKNIQITYIRPLRECTRKEIEQYCEEKKLEPKMDQSNFENTYHRNKIRNQLIPYLEKEFNPNIIEGLNRLSDLAREEEEYFAKIMIETYESLKIGENENEIILDLKKFNLLPKVIKERLLLYTINKIIQTTQGIGKIHIEDIIKLCEKNIGNKYLTPNKKIKIFVQKGKIYFNHILIC